MCVTVNVSGGPALLRTNPLGWGRAVRPHIDADSAGCFQRPCHDFVLKECLKMTGFISRGFVNLIVFPS